MAVTLASEKLFSARRHQALLSKKRETGSKDNAAGQSLSLSRSTISLNSKWWLRRGQVEVCSFVEFSLF